MKPLHEMIREQIDRHHRVFEIVAGLILAVVNSIYAWTALVSGQAKFPFVGSVFSRTSEPLMFHAAMMTWAALALAFLALAYHSWRER